MAAQLAQLTPAELRKTPSIPPPTGVAIDFDGPNGLRVIALTVTTVFMSIAFTFMSIRAYTKVKIRRTRSWDDLTCFLGLMCTLIYWIVFLLQVENEGFGRHFWDIPLAVTISDDFLKLAYLSDWTCNVAYIFVKTTFFILYWNIFKPFRWLKLGIIGGAIIIDVVYLGCTLASVIGATPRVGQTWLESSFTPRNNIGKKLSIPLAAWALVSDVFILVLPISGVLRLQLTPRKKLALSMIFMTGLGACVCSSLSLYYRTLLNDDVTYSVVRIQILIIVELCVGICIACMPAASVFVRHVGPSTATIQSKLETYSSKVRRRFYLPQSRRSIGTRSQQIKSDGRDGPYQNLSNRVVAMSGKEAYDLGLYPAGVVRTNVSAEPFRALSDDKIHLRVDLEQG